jgi:hypothetical protein
MQSDYDVYDDGDVFIPHRIVCQSTWATCRGWHETVEEVKRCFEAANTPGAWPCSWLMESRNEDGIYTYECGAATMYTDRRGSYECARGHDHIPADLMAEMGEAYASDAEEATQLAKAGVRPLQMDGSAFPM